MENIKKTIVENKLFKEGDVVGVAVSGGKDSLFMLNLILWEKNQKYFYIQMEPVVETPERVAMGLFWYFLIQMDKNTKNASNKRTAPAI